MSFITADDGNLPDMSEWLVSQNDERKQYILQHAVERIVASRILTTIENVRDNHEMTFGDTGYVLYQAPNPPKQIHWTLLAIEIDRSARELGREMEAMAHSEAIAEFSRSLPATVVRSVNPSFTIAVAASKFLVEMVQKRLQRSKDDLIGLMYMSLNEQEHYPEGDRTSRDVWDLTRNIQVDYSIFYS